MRKLGHSALVHALLRVNGIDIPVASFGPDYCVLREAKDIDVESNAELVVTVDGKTHLWDVTLPHGAAGFDERVTFETRRPRSRGDESSHGAESFVRTLKNLAGAKAKPTDASDEATAGGDRITGELVYDSGHRDELRRRADGN